jgi:aryl-alcohol dehydrogenase-like predicted oxidoreductase
MTFDDGSWGSRPADSFAILDCYLGLGGNFIDTANFYGGGKSEETLGAYFTANPCKRERVVLATKFCMSLIPDDPNASGAGRKAIIAQLDRSLSRLKTDYVDLYWQHMWDRHTPIEETLSTLNDLVRAGKVRNIGMSNVPAWFVGEAVAIARLRGWEPIAALQVQYSLLTRTVEMESSLAPRAPSASELFPGVPSQTVRSQESIPAREQAIPTPVGLNMRSSTRRPLPCSMFLNASPAR